MEKKSRAVFSRKETEIPAREFVVEKIITLPQEAYQYFCKNLMKEYDFIRENVNLMECKENVYHCLLVMGAGTKEGVLVESEGAAYARYTSFLPDASVFANELIASVEIKQKQQSSEEKSVNDSSDIDISTENIAIQLG
ncbi:MAG: DUF6329 domain-containing protein [Brevinema sp.]